MTRQEDKARPQRRQEESNVLGKEHPRSRPEEPTPQDEDMDEFEEEDEIQE